MAAAVSWAPFRQVVSDLHEINRANTPQASARLDELDAHLRDDFDHVGLDLDEPIVQQSILLTLSCLRKYSDRIHLAGRTSCAEHQAVADHVGPVALAVARRIPAEAVEG